MQANKRRHPKAKPRKRFWSFIRKLALWCLVLAVIGGGRGLLRLHDGLETL